MSLSAVSNSSVYIIGGGVDKRLPIVTVQTKTVFQPYLDKASETADVIAELIEASDPIMSDLNDLLPVEPDSENYPASRVNGEWLITRVEDLANHQLIGLLSLPEVMRLNDFPYLLASGNYVSLVGMPDQAWVDGTSSMYNENMGLVYHIEDEYDSWYVNLRKVEVPATPQRAEDNPVLTPEQIALSTPYYHTRRTRLIPKSEQQDQTLLLLDKITSNRRRISKLEKLVSKLNWKQQRLSGLMFLDWAAQLGSKLSSLIPSGLFSKASGMLNSLNTLKNSTLCFLECTVNTAMEIGAAIFDALGSVSDGSILSSVKISLPDIETLSNCFNLKWLLSMIMGLLSGLLGMLKGLWDALMSLLEWPECSCSGLGGFGADGFGFDLCGFGVKVDKSDPAESEGIGTLDLLRQYSDSALETVAEVGTVLKSKLSWDAGTVA